jgi:hypothetical protein
MAGLMLTLWERRGCPERATEQPPAGIFQLLRHRSKRCAETECAGG